MAIEPDRPAADPAPCTASFRDVRDTVHHCTQDAGHYDLARKPVWPTPLGPPDPGGHHTDGDAIWADHNHGATPHTDRTP